VEGLEGAGEAVDQRPARGGVGEGVDGRCEEVEGDSPVREDGEEAEFVPRGGASAEQGVGAVPALYENKDDEGV
jgi:hypothetical protein